MNAGLGNLNTAYSFKNWTVKGTSRSTTPVLLHVHVTLFSLNVEGCETLIVKINLMQSVFIEIIKM